MHLNKEEISLNQNRERPGSKINTSYTHSVLTQANQSLNNGQDGRDTTIGFNHYLVQKDIYGPEND